MLFLTFFFWLWSNKFNLTILFKAIKLWFYLFSLPFSFQKVAPRNTVGDVPLEWYNDEKHIGYDITGKKIKKKERQDKLDSFLASADDSKNW